jgi:hypothetical protein
VRYLTQSSKGTDTDSAWLTGSLGILDERASRYAAISALVRYPDATPVNAIIVAARMCDSDSLDVGNRALAWAQNVSDPVSLAVEHMRLFGGFGVPGVTGSLISVLGDGSWQPRSFGRMSQLYRCFGYWTEDIDSLTLCPGHATNALGFMSHCLLMGDLGISDATGAAAEFFERYLRDWMPRFGDAVLQEAAHPVTALTGMAISAFAHAETVEMSHESALSAS